MNGCDHADPVERILVRRKRQAERTLLQDGRLVWEPCEGRRPVSGLRQARRLTGALSSGET